MRLLSVAVAILGFTSFLIVPAPSQICAGSASFAAGPLQVAGGAGFTSHAHGFGVTLTLGGSATFFGVGLGTTHFDAYKSSSFDVVAGGGYELPLDQRGVVQLCPVVAVAHTAGPNNISGGVDYSETDVAASLRLGGVATESEHVRVFPTVGLGFEYAAAKLTSTLGGSTTDSHGFGVLSLGLGLVFNKNLTVQPRAAVPIGLDNSSATFGLTLAVNFGH
jgi:hypothetical protein